MAARHPHRTTPAMPKPPSERATGVGLVVAGVLVLSPDGLLTSLIAADPSTALFWRGLLMGLALALWVVLRHRRATLAVVAGMGLSGLAVAILYAASTVFFVHAVKQTSVATALFVVAAAPLFAAVLAWAMLRERTLPRTFLAIAATLAGMGLIFADGIGRGQATGIVMALLTAFTWAALLVVLRRGRVADPAPALALAGLLVAVAMLPFAPTFALEGDDPLWLGVLGLVVLPISFVLIGMGPRYLPAAEVGLLMLLEAVFGPLWAWAILGQTPGSQTLLGGLVILGALAANAVAGIVAERRG